MCNCDALLKYHKIFVIDHHISCSATMRVVEHSLEGILVFKKYVKNNVVVDKIEENGHAVKAHKVEEGSPPNLPRAGTLFKSMSYSSKKEGESTVPPLVPDWKRKVS